MSEADRVFPRHDESTAPAPVERRLIYSAPRRNASGSSVSRAVEVVHLRPSRSAAPEAAPRPAPWNVRAETWPDGFRPKDAPKDALADAVSSAAPAPSVDAADPAPPTAHVMARWEPSIQAAEPPPAAPRKPRGPARTDKPAKSAAPKSPPRPFADPFAEEEGGANCFRCGYLIQPNRERRGLTTCAACG